MTHEKVKSYFKSIELDNRITVRNEISDTAENSAKVIGCEIGQIAKTLSFLLEGEPILVLMSGEAKVDNRKYKLYFGQKPTMIGSDKVEELTGYIPGAVSPYLLPEGVRVYLDISLQRYDILYTAAGSLNSTIELTRDELIEHSKSCGWVDVSKGWKDNEELNQVASF